MTAKIDVIVPVYNAKKTIRECIRSIQKQTFSDWNLIIVDDGSKDDSYNLCKEFSNRDHRIKIIHQENGGSVSARYTGMRQIHADCKYVTFVDSDDKLPPRALEILYRKAEEHQADIVCGKLMRFNSLNIFFKPTVLELQKEEKVFKFGTDGWMRLMQSFYGVTLFPGYMHSKLYRREIIEKAMKFRTPCHFFQEDVAFNLQACLESKCVVGINEVIYYYRMGGGTSKFMPGFLDDCISLYRFKLDTILENNFSRDFAFTTAVELKNELWTWFAMYVREFGRNKPKVIAEVERCCNIEEIIEAVNYPREDYSGKKGFRQMVIEQDVTGIATELYKENGKLITKVKRFIRRLLAI